ncbi:MAG: ATP-dependent DNA helicase [Bryobacterales bacterium]|nr:ATP-dependent DNA helicase [Bryobacteraceae bacterium]MDW8353749.1 ATP-dependent DNA helicase [Bryobacterales bacterium]
MPPPARTLTVRQFFSRGGPLSRTHPQYEFRPGQLEMAEAVEAALAEGRHLIVEAGTGTGKTLAYLAPAILSGQRVVVSTATKNLQEQLFFKDVPLLEKALGRRLRVCYMKGRSNYACRQKIYDAEKEPFLEGLEELADFEIIRDWEKTTQTGDRAEIRSLPESSSVWSKLDARRELCSGQKCPQFERCFITLMRQRAAESDVIIVNHHLFFADLAVRDEDYGGIIPDYAAVVFDEAHEIEDVASQYFGLSVSNYQFEELIRDVAATARQKHFGSPELDRALSALGQYTAQFFALFEAAEGRTGFHEQDKLLERHEEQYRDLLGALELLQVHLEGLPSAPEEVIPLVRRCREIALALQFWMESRDRRYVYWLERRGRGCFLQATPIDVSAILAERLFSGPRVAILTSATLAIAGSFEFVERRLGLLGARTLIVPGQFDWQNQALLYVAPHLPDPRSPLFPSQAAEEIKRLLAFSQGRAFVLFTSYQQMQQVYDRLASELEFPTLLQGTAPRNALLEEFRTTPHAVLFATSSFWQGVDVPGEQLSCVIIDKLPFAVPTDPVVEARVRNIRQEGGNPFYEYQIPQAALMLKQGFGRLIRNRTDRGVLALLDHRIVKQRYGRVFLDSLPPYRFTMDISDVERFFARR